MLPFNINGWIETAISCSKLYIRTFNKRPQTCKLIITILTMPIAEDLVLVWHCWMTKHTIQISTIIRTVFERCLNWYIDDGDDNVNSILISSFFENFEVCFIRLLATAYIFPTSYNILQLFFLCFLVSITRCIAPTRWESLGVARSRLEWIQVDSR
jgi:hypothetical protein